MEDVSYLPSVSIKRLEWRCVRRLLIALRRWARRRMRRRFVNRILAETRDPRILADLGVGPVQPRHVERWIKAMLYHQH